MKKKIAALVPVLFVFTVMNTYAEFGIGIQGNAGYAGNFAGGPSLLLSPSDRLHFAIDWYIPLNNNDILFNLTMDIWVLDLSLVQIGEGSLKLFVGPGFYGRAGYIESGDEYRDGFNLAAGIRIPVGIHYRIQGLDPFICLAPAWDIKFLPKPHFADFFGFSGAIGIRFWL
ncbi:MAG: hypothetical protein LBG74_07980 [Spirochaetaceae bacterium]|nr:hypothetical protein [Spirochaetaceae bacterium]